MEKNKVKGDIEGWLARDEGDELNLYSDKPIKNYSESMWMIRTGTYIELPKKMFNDVSWHEKEPRKVRITIEEI